MQVVSKTRYDFSELKSSTKHFDSRRRRLGEYLHTLKIISSYVVDNNHVNGLEIHVLTTDGRIFIINKDSNRLITIFVARVNQFRKYGIEPTGRLLSILQQNQNLKLNK